MDLFFLPDFLGLESSIEDEEEVCFLFVGELLADLDFGLNPFFLSGLDKAIRFLSVSTLLYFFKDGAIFFIGDVVISAELSDSSFSGFRDVLNLKSFLLTEDLPGDLERGLNSVLELFSLSDSESGPSSASSSKFSW
ncbi:hypothetical protein WICPIJ_001312 [Wickerhamomyces pijperi]|uniref:Uncharacterized protein n=1 Tax=Wickerhamomyces pijperi TaxID=599730 RepID=A0A9P8QDX6_WICPI|nr:hypothetical protein WICPIJ_001312 [Wickerhamomyces pijperi]